jgi:hypothetical protein
MTLPDISTYDRVFYMARTAFNQVETDQLFQDGDLLVLADAVDIRLTMLAEQYAPQHKFVPLGIGSSTTWADVNVIAGTDTYTPYYSSGSPISLPIIYALATYGDGRKEPVAIGGQGSHRYWIEQLPDAKIVIRPRPSENFTLTLFFIIRYRVLDEKKYNGPPSWLSNDFGMTIHECWLATFLYYVASTYGLMRPDIQERYVSATQSLISYLSSYQLQEYILDTDRSLMFGG